MITYSCVQCKKQLDYRFIFDEKCRPIAQATGQSFRIIEIQRISIRGTAVEDTQAICDECYKELRDLAIKHGKKARNE